MIFNIHDKFEKTFIVSTEIYEGFIRTFKDTNPLHIWDQYAIEFGFKERVMHGNILNGFISYFIGECLPVKHVIIHSQQIQFRNPVYLNDELQFKAKVSDLHEAVNAVEFKFIFKNKEQKVVAKGQIQIGLLT